MTTSRPSDVCTMSKSIWFSSWFSQEGRHELSMELSKIFSSASRCDSPTWFKKWRIELVSLGSSLSSLSPTLFFLLFFSATCSLSLFIFVTVLWKKPLLDACNRAVRYNRRLLDVWWDKQQEQNTFSCVYWYCNNTVTRWTAGLQRTSRSADSFLNDTVVQTYTHMVQYSLYCMYVYRYRRCIIHCTFKVNCTGGYLVPYNKMCF